jgi:hypothetical protein
VYCEEYARIISPPFKLPDKERLIVICLCDRLPSSSKTI